MQQTVGKGSTEKKIYDTQDMSTLLTRMLSHMGQRSGTTVPQVAEVMEVVEDLPTAAADQLVVPQEGEEEKVPGIHLLDLLDEQWDPDDYVTQYIDIHDNLWYAKM